MGWGGRIAEWVRGGPEFEVKDKEDYKMNLPPRDTPDSEWKRVPSLEDQAKFKLMGLDEDGLEYAPTDQHAVRPYLVNPTDRVFTRQDRERIYQQRVLRDAKNPPPEYKKITIWGINGGYSTEAAACIAAKMQEHDPDMQVEVHTTRSYKWPATAQSKHMSYLKPETLNMKPPFIVETTPYKRSPTAYLGGTAELAKRAREEYGVRTEECRWMHIPRDKEGE
ncbi:hypothetical protein PROFUN_03256 [Planoprotostelium fungivorum]|uniref:Uncharacterized protein n=1 Tax=Planoprotostelium fungivorum TaxID=1890364 RepID=A0A2P6NWJ9_9EUKA|nr:hypothetical protein PROFUN_03256 [Planoprotostelium fungivorum]